MHRSRLSQILVDVPEERFETETAFWATALGAEPRADPDDPEYISLGEPIPGLGVMVQRVGAPARLHLDIETDDVEAEVQRLDRLGATRVRPVSTWWVMEDPAGLLFCVVRVQNREAFERDATTWAPGAPP